MTTVIDEKDMAAAAIKGLRAVQKMDIAHLRRMARQQHLIEGIEFFI